MLSVRVEEGLVDYRLSVIDACPLWANNHLLYEVIILVGAEVYLGT